VEPRREQGVQPRVQRFSPATIAAIALALLVLIMGTVLLLQSRNGGSDRLTGNEAEAAAKEDPERLCTRQATYDTIKRDLFRRAAAVRGSDQAAFDKIASYSSLRVEAPIVREQDKAVGSVTCSATLWLDLPPGVAVVGGRTNLTAEVAYTVQPAADGSGDTVALSNADAIVTPLATLARTSAPAAEAPVASNELAPAAPAAPADPLAPLPPSRPSAPTAPEPPAASQRPPASPSFNCANARTRGEIAVCESPGLAALDRTMAAQYSGAVARADPAQRALLARTRDSFLRYRDRCPSDECIAQTYRGRMREIRDIMTGSWSPQR